MSLGKNRSHTGVLIIGGGISGICTAIDLIRSNKSRDFTIVEKSTQFGGTWHDNVYPGCCCDVWSHLYSFSFAPNPDWSREFPEQDEIEKYLISVAENWRLYQHARFNTTVQEARWDESKSQWKVLLKVGGGKEAEFSEQYFMTCDFLISGVGQLNYPHYPEIPGLEAFRGKMMHSARWDWTYSLEGKRVGIIGNGSTAAQIIPEVAKVCKKLTVFQRTPNWVQPREDGPISQSRRMIYRYIPGVRKLYRSRLMDKREGFFHAAAELESGDKDLLKQDALDLLRRQIPDNAELRQKLTPDYPPGCKRIIMSDDFYPALDRPNVYLETKRIAKITNNGVAAEDRLHELDVLILATGFRTTEFLYPIKNFGQNGRPIEDVWEKAPRAYLGVSVESMPNFAMLYGPNTNLGHNSIILMIEAQARYIAALVSPVQNARQHGETLSISPSLAKVEEYNAAIQSRLRQSTFALPACNSWYKTADGTVTNNWCGTAVEYQKIMSTVDWHDYDRSGSGAWRIADDSPKKLGRVVEESQVSLLGLCGTLAVSAVILLGMSRTSLPFFLAQKFS